MPSSVCSRSIFRASPIRALEREYPVVWIDALYKKIRLEDRVVNMAVMVVTGINSSGNREILAVEPMYNEPEDTYAVLFQKLKQRGLEQVWLVVSDAHAGPQAAIAKSFLGASWQRCRIHFMRKSCRGCRRGTKSASPPS
jgi:transposase-like protein